MVVKDADLSAYKKEFADRIASGVIRIMSESELSTYIQAQIAQAVDDATAETVKQFLVKLAGLDAELGYWKEQAKNPSPWAVGVPAALCGIVVGAVSVALVKR